MQQAVGAKRAETQAQGKPCKGRIIQIIMRFKYAPPTGAMDWEWG